MAKKPENLDDMMDMVELEPDSVTPDEADPHVDLSDEEREEMSEMFDDDLLIDIPDTEKHKKFRDAAEKRVNRIAKQLRQLGELSRKAAYEFDTEEVDKMFEFLRSELNECEHKFAPPELFRFD